MAVTITTTPALVCAFDRGVACGFATTLAMPILLSVEVGPAFSGTVKLDDDFFTIEVETGLDAVVDFAELEISGEFVAGQEFSGRCDFPDMEIHGETAPEANIYIDDWLISGDVQTDQVFAGRVDLEVDVQGQGETGPTFQGVMNFPDIDTGGQVRADNVFAGAVDMDDVFALVVSAYVCPTFAGRVFMGMDDFDPLITLVAGLSQDVNGLIEMEIDVSGVIATTRHFDVLRFNDAEG